MRKKTILIFGILFFFCFVYSEFCQSQTISSYHVRKWSISASGGVVTSSSFCMKESALGGIAVGMSASNNYVLNSGMLIIDVDDPLFKQDALPKMFELQQNFPNPFNPTTTIRYNLPKTSNVTVYIYNTVGQIVRKLNQPGQQPGSHQLTWDGKDETGQLLPSGVYMYQIEAEGFTDVKKMLLMK